MSGMIILDVAIGLIFIYLLLSLICSALQEVLASAMRLRSNNLEAGIKNLLADPSVADLSGKLYAHPLIKGLAKEGNKPSYIPAQTFVLALMDTIKDPANEGGPIALARESVDGLPDGELKRALLALVSDAEGSADQVRKNLERWFDHAMDRASGWYKRKAKMFMFLIALGLAAGMNVDSIHVASSLWKDQGLRQAIIAQAVAFNASGLSASNAQKTYGELQLELDKVKNLSLPIGWRNGAFNLLDKQSCLLALIGWLMTALCVSLGAPFWFDALGKALSIRAAGRRPKKSADTE